MSRPTPKSKVIQDEIEQLRAIGWEFEASTEGIMVTWPEKYIEQLGMEPKAHTWFASWRNTSCWCRGFTQAMQMAE
jgi:hypothetical protein